MPTLLTSANRLRKAAEAFSQRQQTQRKATGLYTRRGELEPLVTQASRCHKSCKAIRSGGASVKIPSQNLNAAKKSLDALRAKFEQDWEEVTKPGALDAATLRDVIDECTSSARVAWHSFVDPPSENDPLVEVLERFPSLKKAAAQLSDIRESIRQAAAQLPKTKRDITKVAKLKSQQEECLSLLEKSGINDEVVDFLRRCATGVPLTELIDRPSLLEWIRNNELLDSFTVRG